MSSSRVNSSVADESSAGSGYVHVLLIGEGSTLVERISLKVLSFEKCTSLLATSVFDKELVNAMFFTTFGS